MKFFDWEQNSICYFKFYRVLRHHLFLRLLELCIFFKYAPLLTVAVFKLRAGCPTQFKNCNGRGRNSGAYFKKKLSKDLYFVKNSFLSGPSL